MQFEAEVRRREQELQLERSLNDVKRAETKLESQRVINTEEERKLELRVSQAKAELEKAIVDKESLTLTAPMAGLVVYPKVWSGGSNPQKVQEGDTPWPGQPIIELPDLSEMEVATEVSEIDVSKVELGQKVEIRLDAFPESLFVGSVTSVATLAKERGEENPAKVFEVTVVIDNTSPILRPGMTASARIIVDELPERLWIPVDGVFSADDTTVVYRVEGGSLLQTPVALGPKNENAVVVTAGLDVDDVVSLVEPGVQIETLTTEPKQRAGGSTRGSSTRSSGRVTRR
jgi:RND family efflux transporter MFP subunit